MGLRSRAQSEPVRAAAAPELPLRKRSEAVDLEEDEKQ